MVKITIWSAHRSYIDEHHNPPNLQFLKCKTMKEFSSLEQYVKVFKAFRSVKILYLPPFSETNEWGFRLVMTGISEISEDFPKTFKRRRKCPKMFQRPLSTSEAVLMATFLRVEIKLRAFLEYFLEYSIYFMLLAMC